MTISQIFVTFEYYLFLWHTKLNLDVPGLLPITICDIIFIRSTLSNAIVIILFLLSEKSIKRRWNTASGILVFRKLKDNDLNKYLSSYSSVVTKNHVRESQGKFCILLAFHFIGISMICTCLHMHGICSICIQR